MLIKIGEKMDWTNIITALIGAILAGGISVPLTIRQIRKKGNLENESLAIETLSRVISELKEERMVMKEEIEKLKQENEALRREKEDKAEENASCKNAMCLHWACILRFPGIGRGDEYYQEHHADPAMGGDYEPVNNLLKLYGAEKKKRAEIQKEKIANDQASCTD